MKKRWIFFLTVLCLLFSRFPLYAESNDFSSTLPVSGPNSSTMFLDFETNKLYTFTDPEYSDVDLWITNDLRLDVAKAYNGIIDKGIKDYNNIKIEPIYEKMPENVELEVGHVYIVRLNNQKYIKLKVNSFTYDNGADIIYSFIEPVELRETEAFSKDASGNVTIALPASSAGRPTMFLDFEANKKYTFTDPEYADVDLWITDDLKLDVAKEYNGIIDKGIVDYNSIKIDPMYGKMPENAQLKVGHVYVVRLKNQRYVKLKVNSFKNEGDQYGYEASITYCFIKPTALEAAKSISKDKSKLVNFNITLPISNSNNGALFLDFEYGKFFTFTDPEYAVVDLWLTNDLQLDVAKTYNGIIDKGAVNYDNLEITPIKDKLPTAAKLIAGHTYIIRIKENIYVKFKVNSFKNVVDKYDNGANITYSFVEVKDAANTKLMDNIKAQYGNTLSDNEKYIEWLKQQQLPAIKEYQMLQLKQQTIIKAYQAQIDAVNKSRLLEIQEDLDRANNWRTQSLIDSFDYFK